MFFFFFYDKLAKILKKKSGLSAALKESIKKQKKNDNGTIFGWYVISFVSKYTNIFI